MTTWIFTGAADDDFFDSNNWEEKGATTIYGVPGQSDTAVINGNVSIGTAAYDLGALDLEGGSLIGISAPNSGLNCLLGSYISGGYIGGSIILNLNQTSVIGGFTLGGSAIMHNFGTADDTVGFTIGDSSGTGATFYNWDNCTFNFENSLTISSGAQTAQFVNNGTINTAAGTALSADLNVNFNNVGTINVASGTSLEVGGNGDSEIGGTVSGQGTFILGPGDETIENGAVLNVASLEITGSYPYIVFQENIKYSGNFSIIAQPNAYTSIDLNGNTLTLSGSTLFQGGAFGVAYFEGGGTLQTEGSTSFAAEGPWTEFQLGSATTWINSGAASIAGMIVLGDSGDLPAKLLNTSLGILNLIADINIYEGSTPGSTIDNAGLLEKTGVGGGRGAGFSGIDVAVMNSGTITSIAGVLRFDDSITNLGTIRANGGIIEVDDAIVNTGKVSAANGSAVYLNGGGTLGGTIGGGGGAVILSGQFNVLGQQTDTVKFLAGASFAGVGSSTAFLSGAGTIKTVGTTTVANNGGWALWLENGVTWQNAGTVNDAGDIRFGAGGGDNVTLVNASGATFNIGVEGTAVFQSYGGGGVIENAGMFVKSAGIGVSDIQLYFVNTGTISANSGTLEFDSGGILGGTIGGGAGQVVLDGYFGVATDQTETVKFGSGVSFAANGTGPAYLGGDGTIATSGTVAIGNNGNNGGASLWLQNDVTWQNDGTVNDGGDFRFGGSSGDSVELNNASGATFNVDAEGLVFQNSSGGGGAIVNEGTFVKSAGTSVSEIQVYFVNSGTISADSGTLEFDGGGTLGGTIGGGAGNVVLTGTYGVAAGQTEDVTFASGASFAALDTSAADLSGPGTIVSSGTLAIAFNGGTSLTLGDEVLWQNDGVVNDAGYVEFGFFSHDAVTLDNALGATFNVSATGTIFQDANSGGGVFDNAGTFDKTTKSGVTMIATAFENAGKVVVTGGALDFMDGVSGAGKFNVAAGATVSVNGALSGGGTVDLVGAGSVADIYGATDDNFSFGSSSTSTLMLDDYLDFAGTITGFAGKNIIDLANMSDGKVTLGYTKHTGFGVLNIKDTLNGVTEIAHLTFEGAYLLSDFYHVGIAGGGLKIGFH